eukprot:jgi/Bigna1/90802/estExt_fgenesh1_pg.C_790092
MLGNPPPTSNSRSRRSQKPADTSTLTDEEYLELKERLEKFQDTLRRMSTQSGNKRCADCREHNPRYIDVQWGVYLCLLCSGAHEKVLGTTIVTVDTTEVDEQWITTLEQRGNAKVNDDLEYKLETSDKRKMSWSITNRAKFVNRKYVNGEWIRKGATIDLQNPSKVAPVPEMADGGKKKKKKDKKDKKKKRKDKKKAKQDVEEVAFPAGETAQASAAPPSEAQKSNGGLTDLFGILSVDEGNSDAKTQQPAQPVSQPGKPVEAKNLVSEKTTNDIMAMFENPAPQQQPQQQQAQYGGGFGGGYGTGQTAYGTQRAYGGGMPAQASHNPFMNQQRGGVNPFAQGATGYPQQQQQQQYQQYGGGAYSQQAYAPQQQQQQMANQTWQLQQQNTAFQQQQLMQQRQQQQQQQQQQDANNIMNFF